MTAGGFERQRFFYRLPTTVYCLLAFCLVVALHLSAEFSRSRRSRRALLMQGVVTLLDDQHYARVEAIWEELGQKFDVRGMYVTPYPHFSFQVAEQYDESACESFLRDLAARTRPFRVRTAGLGIFTVASPILYISVVRSPPLSAPRPPPPPPGARRGPPPSSPAPPPSLSLGCVPTPALSALHREIWDGV